MPAARGGTGGQAGAPVGRANLFAVDAEAVGRLVAEANLALANRVRELLAALERMPRQLADDDGVRRAETFARQIRAAMAEARRAKQADKAPFGAAAKVIDGFFDSVTKPLDRALRVVEGALTEARQRAVLAAPPASAATPLVSGPAGAVVIGAVSAATALATVWKAEHIDRAALDLEALRGHFTDMELDRAVARWLAENGATPLAGVRWIEAVTTRGA